ncbi:hypothetical protein CC2G_001658 [Coprinopsis cinerea AmutBmut pab1-1]|nr:hypothetical protein CC2G_001658 [Coprinopsis cinerea AmutBmut pab1-1]KAG2024066.1 hypothetical protein CC2G_001658 [Coprinopsis cinerea AmutBmut pab1-1]
MSGLRVLKTSVSTLLRQCSHPVATRALSTAAVANSARRGPWSTSSAVQKRFSGPQRLSIRSPFSTSSRTANEASKSENPGYQDVPWVDLLEGTAKAPWLTELVPDEELRLKIAHGLIRTIIIYLTKPGGEGGEDAAAQYLSLFQSASVPADSEMARARIAIAIILQGVAKQINSVDQKSQMRLFLKPVFDAGEKLQKVNEKFLDEQGAWKNFDVWGDYWSTVQQPFLEAYDSLQKAGMELPMEEP